MVHRATAFANLVIPAKAGTQRTKQLTERSETEVLREVPPIGIGGLDELKLPCPVPFLDPLLARDRRFHCCMLLRPDEQLHAVLVGETAHQSLSVLVDTSDEVRSDASVEGAISL